MGVCSDNFINQTAKDYALEEYVVRSVLNKSKNLVAFYEKLETELGF